MIFNVSVVEMQLGLIGIVVFKLETCIVAELEIGSIEQLIVLDVPEQAQVVVAVEFAGPFGFVKTAHLVFEKDPHFLGQIIDVFKIGIKRAAVQTTSFAYIGNCDFMQFPGLE
jgi:hypothetical protein